LRKKSILGFTMVELMFVISLLAILIAIAIPNYTRFKRRQAYKSAANELAADLTRASAEALRSEQYVWVIFNTDTQNGKIYYTVSRDYNDDLLTTNDDKPDTGLIGRKYPARDYMGATLWGKGLADAKKISFGRGGAVDRSLTDLTFIAEGGGSSSGHYSIMVSSASGVEIPNDTYEVRVEDNGKVTVIPKKVEEK
jgi:prepilin-type N-terminal cleavage/methylation domain-containing protein